MGKQSGFLARVQAQQHAAEREAQRLTRQTICDLSLLVLNEEFGFGEERLHRFAMGLQDKYADFADLWNTDTKDREYAKSRLDRALKQICGQYYVPWEERYE